MYYVYLGTWEEFAEALDFNRGPLCFYFVMPDVRLSSFREPSHPLVGGGSIGQLVLCKWIGTSSVSHSNEVETY